MLILKLIHASEKRDPWRPERLLSEITVILLIMQTTNTSIDVFQIGLISHMTERKENIDVPSPKSLLWDGKGR